MVKSQPGKQNEQDGEQNDAHGKGDLVLHLAPVPPLNS
jgi:hypothetical protein